MTTYMANDEYEALIEGLREAIVGQKFTCPVFGIVDKDLM